MFCTKERVSLAGSLSIGHASHDLAMRPYHSPGQAVKRVLFRCWRCLFCLATGLPSGIANVVCRQNLLLHVRSLCARQLRIAVLAVPHMQRARISTPSDTKSAQATRVKDCVLYSFWCVFFCISSKRGQSGVSLRLRRSVARD